MSVLLPIDRIANHFNPLKNPPWEIEAIATDEIKAAMLNGGCEEQHPRSVFAPDWTRAKHIARIAYLVLHGWTEPIDIDVGVPSLGCFVAWPILDGNHRLAAAIYRGDKSIASSVGGDMDLAEDLFGVSCLEHIAAQV